MVHCSTRVQSMVHVYTRVCTPWSAVLSCVRAMVVYSGQCTGGHRSVRARQRARTHVTQLGTADTGYHEGDGGNI